MSHFTVLVVLPEEPTDENKLLEKALQPFHEYECTGVKDEYVTFVDEHDEVTKEWNTDTIEMWKNETGKLYSEYNDRFYREPTSDEKSKIGIGGIGCTNGFSYSSKDWGDGRGYRPKVHMTDENISGVGFEKVSVLRKETGEYEDLLDFATQYHGYEVHNGKIGRWTNPNRKWDWWQVGGRWSGKLKAKDPAKAVRGERGLMDSSYDNYGFDGMEVGNLDLDAMTKTAINICKDSVLNNIAEKGVEYEQAVELWGKYLDAKDDVHQQWKDLPKGKPNYFDWLEQQGAGNPVFDARKSGVADAWGAGLPDTARDPLEYASTRPALTCWAYLEDGVWSEKGEMGWFGMSSNDKDPEEWEGEVMKRIASLPSDYWIVMVDCHI